MRLRLIRSGGPKRDGQGGAAALEFALATFLLVPLLWGIIDFGYYFYISINVVEAERAGLIAAARTTGVGACATTSTAASNGSSAVTSYLTLNSLNSLVTVSGTSSTPSCATTPISPTWTMNLIVDYAPLLGRVMPWDKASPSPGKLRYTVGTLAMRGSN